jgi:transketolase
MPESMPFVIGKGIMMHKGTDVTIIATGHLVAYAMEATQKLQEQGISAELINIHTIKPLDEEIILDSISKTRCVVTAEEHQRNGGLGDAIAQLLARKNPTPQEYVAVNDSFGESGKPDELLLKYGLGPNDILNAVQSVLQRKK